MKAPIVKGQLTVCGRTLRPFSNGPILTMTDQIEMPRRLFGKAVQQGRSERKGESYSGP